MDELEGIAIAPVETAEHAIEEPEHHVEKTEHNAAHAEHQETLEHIAEQVTETRALEEAEQWTNLHSSLTETQSRLSALEAKIDSLPLTLAASASTPMESRSRESEEGPKEVEIAVEPLETEPKKVSRRLPYRRRRR